MAPSSDREGKNSLAQNYLWASRASSIAMSAVIPAALGYWADSRWGTFPWLLIAGAGLGFVSMLSGLIRLTETTPHKGKDRRPDSTVETPKD